MRRRRKHFFWIVEDCCCYRVRKEQIQVFLAVLKNSNFSKKTQESANLKGRFVKAKLNFKLKIHDISFFIEEKTKTSKFCLKIITFQRFLVKNSMNFSENLRISQLELLKIGPKKPRMTRNLFLRTL